MIAKKKKEKKKKKKKKSEEEEGETNFRGPLHPHVYVRVDSRWPENSRWIPLSSPSDKNVILALKRK